MSRPKIVAGNWKMNKTLQEAENLVQGIISKLNEFDEVTKIIIPPFPYITRVQQLTANQHTIFIGAQNCHSEASGAYTGEVSAGMLASIGCNYVIIGHSERRLYFKEQDYELVAKIKEVLKHGMKPIFCIGETLQERKGNTHFTVITNQLKHVLQHFTIQDVTNFIIAYEPVWAIGTGETATAAQAQEMHAFIRDILADLFDSSLATQIPLLYGGSCNAQNASELFACPDVDGGLIGGASLKADDFCKIIYSF